MSAAASTTQQLSIRVGQRLRTLPEQRRQEAQSRIEQQFVRDTTTRPRVGDRNDRWCSELTPGDTEADLRAIHSRWLTSHTIPLNRRSSSEVDTTEGYSQPIACVGSQAP